MSESFEQLFEETEMKQIHNGAVVTGKVISVKPDEIVLNINYKADGVISRNEYTNDSSADLTELVHEGDELSCKVIKVNDGDGQVQLSYRRLSAERASKRLEEAFENKEVLRATVTQVLSGGLSVMIDDTRVFIPASLVSDTFERDLNKYNGKEVEFVIIEFNPRKRRIIGDCKTLIVERKKKAKEELFANICEGMIIEEGVVKNVTEFGAFVDLGGADGLIHISQMGWGRLESPKKVFKPGQKVRCFVLKIEGEKIALSMRFPEDNPWRNAEEKYAVGTVVTGKVVRMTEFGAFVELEPGVDALLHVSQISAERVNKPSDVLSNGQVITAKITDLNVADNKINLSMKALLMDKAEEAAPQEEDSVVASAGPAEDEE